MTDKKSKEEERKKRNDEDDERKRKRDWDNNAFNPLNPASPINNPPPISF